MWMEQQEALWKVGDGKATSYNANGARAGGAAIILWVFDKLLACSHIMHDSCNSIEPQITMLLLSL